MGQIQTKQSFERRLKRKGIQLRSPQRQADQVKLSTLKGLEFWIWDKVEHERRYRATNGRCCFQHVISLPRKGNIPKPLFDYEREVVEALQETKYVFVKKATGLGITELILRWIAWMGLKDDKLKGSQVCVITGPRVDLAITLIKRLKGLFPDVVFDDEETVCTLNNCRIEAFPSHTLDSARGLDRVSIMFLDEADFFPPGQQQQARAMRDISPSLTIILLWLARPTSQKGSLKR